MFGVPKFLFWPFHLYPIGHCRNPTRWGEWVNLDSKGKLFADDAKVYRRIKNAQDKTVLQEDLNKLHSWSKKWLLMFNQEKCRIMHIGKKNPQHSYTLGGSSLQESRKEKDLGVLVTSSMKVADQVAAAATAANSMLGRIRRTFTCLDQQTLPALYKALFRPRLEYAVQAWSPQLKKDILKLERVQRRALNGP